MKDLRAENKRLLEKIQNMNNEKLDLETQVDKLHDELQEQFERYKDELDQKKILLQEISDMRDQKDDLLASKEGDTGEPQDDPVMLKIWLRLVGFYICTMLMCMYFLSEFLVHILIFEDCKQALSVFTSNIQIVTFQIF